MVNKAIKHLAIYEEDGLEDLNTMSSSKVVSPSSVKTAIELFEQNENGNYLANIIKTPFFTLKEQEVISQHLEHIR